MYTVITAVVIHIAITTITVVVYSTLYYSSNSSDSNSTKCKYYTEIIIVTVATEAVAGGQVRLYILYSLYQKEKHHQHHFSIL